MGCYRPQQPLTSFLPTTLLNHCTLSIKTEPRPTTKESGPRIRTLPLALAFPLGLIDCPRKRYYHYCFIHPPKNEQTGHSPLTWWKKERVQLGTQRDETQRDRTGVDRKRAMALEPSHYELRKPNNASKLFDDSHPREISEIRYTPTPSLGGQQIIRKSRADRDTLGGE